MSSQADLNKEILEARKKFSEMYGNLKLGGKGTQKRKKLVAHKSSAQQDKKISNLAKKSRKCFLFRIFNRSQKIE